MSYVYINREIYPNQLVQDDPLDDNYAKGYSYDEVIIYQFTPVHFDASQPQPTPATPRPLPGSPPVTYLIGLEDSVFLTQISLCS